MGAWPAGGTRLVVPCPADPTAAERERLVWYVAYGSNLSPVRLACYLAGGRPPGAHRTYDGSLDRRGPLACRPATLPHQLYFAGHSSVWGGAPAFVDLAPAPPGRSTLARAYLLRWRQFEDLVAQENGRTHTPVALDDEAFVVGSHHQLGPRRYETLLGLGSMAVPPGVGTARRAPAVTFTAPDGLAAAEPAAPSEAYLRLLVAGLRATYALSDDELAGYLQAAPGASAHSVAAVIGQRAGWSGGGRG